MEQFKISTITEQFPNLLAQGDGGSVVLAAEGETWLLEGIPTTGGGDTRTIAAPNLGPLQALAYLTPVFNPGCEEVTGDVRLSLEAADRFPWVFQETESNGTTISARPENIPDGVIFPGAGRVLLAWEGTTVKWVFVRGDESPTNSAVWVLDKVANNEALPPDATGRYKISTITRQRDNQLAQGEGGSVVLAAEGDEWLLENIVTTEGGDNRTIAATRLGMSQVLAYITPVFNPGCDEVTGDVRLDATNQFPWVFQGSDSVVSTITARPDSIPDDVSFPAGGRVLLAWEGTTVKWVFVPEDASPANNAIWLLDKVANNEAPPPSTTGMYKIATLTKQIPNELAQAEGGSVVLAVQGDQWLLESIFTTDVVDTRAIVATRLGQLPVLAYLTPVFNPGCEEVSGDVQLSNQGVGKFPWVFQEKSDSGVFVITARADSIPDGVTFPTEGQVFLVWEGATVKWVFSPAGDDPANAVWVLAKV